MKVVSAFLLALVVGYTVSLSVKPVEAQTTAPPVPAVATPKDELVDAWLDTAKLAAQLANSQCQQLDSVKQFQRVQAETAKKVEARLPGYTVNWQTFAVERTPPAKPAAGK